MAEIITTQERYAAATQSSSLRVQGENIPGDADYLIAAGWCKSRFGAALMRLQAEWDGAERWGIKVPVKPTRRAIITFHRVVPPLDNSDHIEQIVPYVGGSGNGSGRKFHIRAGITGRAIRDKSVYVMDRDSDSFEDYKRQLITDWGYTEADARGFTSDRFSLMAIPVASNDGQTVLGVVYLDCSKKKFFASEIVKEAALSGCVGVTRYTGERYV